MLIRMKLFAAKKILPGPRHTTRIMKALAICFNSVDGLDSFSSQIVRILILGHKRLSIYSRTPLTRTLKGNENLFELAGFRVIGVD